MGKVMKHCEPSCRFFRCEQRALIVRRGPREFQRGYREPKTMTNVIFCSWAGGVCDGPRCVYGYCEKRALMPNGLCSLEIREGAREVRSIEEEAAKEKSIKIKGRLLQKLKEKEFIG